MVSNKHLLADTVEATTFKKDLKQIDDTKKGWL